MSWPPAVCGLLDPDGYVYAPRYGPHHLQMTLSLRATYFGHRYSTTRRGAEGAVLDLSRTRNPPLYPPPGVFTQGQGRCHPGGPLYWRRRNIGLSHTLMSLARSPSRTPCQLLSIIRGYRNRYDRRRRSVKVSFGGGGVVGRYLLIPRQIIAVISARRKTNGTWRGLAYLVAGGEASGFKTG